MLKRLLSGLLVGLLCSPLSAGSWDFDQTQEVYLPNSITVEDLSVVVWWQTDGASTNAPLIHVSNTGSGSNGWWFWISLDGGSDYVTLSFADADFTSDAITTPTTDVWYCSAATFDDSANTVQYYHKRTTETLADQGSDTTALSVSNVSDKPVIGNWNNFYVNLGANAGMNGSIGLVAVSSDVKTQSQVEAACAGDAIGSSPWLVYSVPDMDIELDPDGIAPIMDTFTDFSSDQEISAPTPSTTPYARGWDESSSVVFVRDSTNEKVKSKQGDSNGGAASIHKKKFKNAIIAMTYDTLSDAAGGRAINVQTRVQVSTSMSFANGQSYLCEYHNYPTAGTDDVHLYQGNGGSQDTIEEDLDFGDYTAGDVLTMWTVGDCHRCYINNTKHLDSCDSTYSDGYIGWFGTDDATPRYSEFRYMWFNGFRDLSGSGQDTIQFDATYVDATPPWMMTKR